MRKKNMEEDKNLPLLTDDEIGQQVKKDMIEALQTEVKQLSEQLEDEQKTLANYEEQWLVDKEMAEIILDNFEKINPDMKYEQLDRYWELRKKTFWYKHRQDKFQAEKRIESYKVNIDKIKELINGAKEKLAKLEEE